MTPEERLGAKLIELRDSGQLTSGKGGPLVEEAYSETRRVRWLRELRRRVSALDVSAGLAQMTTRLEVLADERVLQRIEKLTEWLQECPLETRKPESDTETKQ